MAQSALITAGQVAPSLPALPTAPLSPRRAFTLIELLTVIAIITVLAAILFPVFTQAREKARQAACLNNMKQIGLAFTSYLQDYNEAFPPTDFGPAAPPEARITWYELIDSYVKSGITLVNSAKKQRKSVFYCPDYDFATPDPNPAIRGFNLTRGAESYVSNTNLMPHYRNLAPPYSSPVHVLAEVEYATNVVLTGPGLGKDPDADGNDSRYDYTFSHVDDAMYMNARTRHLWGANYLAVDGHARWFPAPANYQARSMGGIVWEKCDGPFGARGVMWWFPLKGTVPQSDPTCH